MLYSRLGFVGGTSLERDLQDSVFEANEERPVAVQDLKAQDWLLDTGPMELHLFQVTTLQVFVGRGQSLQDGAIF